MVAEPLPPPGVNVSARSRAQGGFVSFMFQETILSVGLAMCFVAGLGAPEVERLFAAFERCPYSHLIAAVPARRIWRSPLRPEMLPVKR